MTWESWSTSTVGTRGRRTGGVGPRSSAEEEEGPARRVQMSNETVTDESDPDSECGPDEGLVTELRSGTCLRT